MSFHKKIGILLVNLGTPDAPNRSAVHRYLTQFLTDGRVIDINPISRNLLVRGVIVPFRAGKSASLYKMLWTPAGSPLKVYGYSLKEKVQTALGTDYVVELAMRYQSPSIEEGIEKILESKVSEIVILPLFPQYASASTGSVYEEIMRILSKKQAIPALRFINSFYDHPLMIEAFAERAREQDISKYDHILFSYHGLPVRQLVKSDLSGQHCQKVENCCAELNPSNQFCYSAQCFATTKALTKVLDLKPEQYTVCFQSRLGNTPWIQPYTSDVIKKRYDAGDRNILVLCPAFIADCLETTVEISHEYAEEFENLGGESLQLVEGLNDHPKWVEAVCNLVKNS
jgi:ferrochelatase